MCQITHTGPLEYEKFQIQNLRNGLKGSKKETAIVWLWSQNLSSLQLQLETNEGCEWPSWVSARDPTGRCIQIYQFQIYQRIGLFAQKLCSLFFSFFLQTVKGFHPEMVEMDHSCSVTEAETSCQFAAAGLEVSSCGSQEIQSTVMKRSQHSFFHEHTSFPRDTALSQGQCRALHLAGPGPLLIFMHLLRFSLIQNVQTVFLSSDKPFKMWKQ